MSIKKQLPTPHSLPPRSWLRWSSLGIVAIGILLSLHSSQAEFEVPLIDTVGALNAVQFRSVWAYNRGSTPGTTGAKVYNNYEAFAVGIDPDTSLVDGNGASSPNHNCPNANVNTKKEDCNGIFYYYNGSNWQRTLAPFASTYNSGNVFSLNAVTGQYNDEFGRPDLLWVVGPDRQIGKISAYSTTPGETGADQFTQMAGKSGTRDLYAIGAAQNYYGNVIAGGQNGLVLAGQGNSSSFSPPTLPGSLNSSVNVTSIKFANFTTAYVLASTFPPDASDGDQRKAPYLHDDASCGTQTTYLYKVEYEKVGVGTWKEIAKQDGICGYDLTVGTRSSDPTSPNQGPLRNIIWMATSNGVYKYDEQGGGGISFQDSTVTGTSFIPPKPLYAITAAKDRGGAGVSLLSNGDLYNHIDTAQNATSSKADGWLYTDDLKGPNHQNIYPNSGAGECFTNDTDFQTVADRNVSVSGNQTGAVQIWPSPSYNPKYSSPFLASICYSGFDQYYTEQMTQQIDVSTIEGQQFRVTGYVKVEFPTQPSNYPKLDGISSPLGPHVLTSGNAAPQGGVAIGCTGSTNNTVKTYKGQLQAGFTNCSLRNRSYITVDDGSHTGTAAYQNGWRPIDITLSREDLIFTKLGASLSSSITPRRMYLNISCEATYGARVTCDDLKVEEVSSPTITPRDTFTVIAAGKDIATNGMVGNSDALNNDNFTTESLPNKVRSDALLTPAATTAVLSNVNALLAIGTQHMFAVGEGHIGTASTGTPVGVTAFTRTPSTLTGTIWAGASSATGGTSPTGIGKILASCADTKVTNSTTNLTQTLCQNNPQSFGLSLDITSQVKDATTNNAVTKIGVLTGRAWLGKDSGTNADTETLNLGSCNTVTAPNGTDYLLTGACDYYPFESLVSGQPTGSRRCWNKLTSGKALTNTSCISDYDCYGHCQNDQGFLCVKNDDCQVGATSGSSTVSGALTCSAASRAHPPGSSCTTDAYCGGNGTCDSSTANFGTQPANRLQCGIAANGIPSSPLACTSIGWLTFNGSDLASNQLIVPRCNIPTGAQTGTCINDSTKTCSQINVSNCPLSYKGFTYGTIGAYYNQLYSTHNNSYYQSQNRGAHELSGWGRFMSLTKAANTYNQDGGWVHLRSTESATASGTELFNCRDCDSETSDNKTCAFCQDTASHSCIPTNTPAAGQGCYYECQGDTSGPGGTPTHCGGSNAECTGKGTGLCLAPGRCSLSGIACATDTTCGSSGGSCVFGAICRTTASQCVKYGVHLDTETSTFIGNAWSQDFGWLDFSAVSYGGSRLIQTKLGDIYATKQIGISGQATQTPGSNTCNSTYLITSASSITGFCSALGTTTANLGNPVQQNANQIPLISSDNSYQNILGRFDLTGMGNDIGGGKNKYGNTIVTINAGADNNLAGGASDSFNTKLSANSSILGGKVYVTKAATPTPTEYTMDSSMTFVNSSNLTNYGSGNGILIVNGNLTINQPLTYTSGSINDLRKLASLTIVVKGDLKIGNKVKDVVGAFYVTGTIRTTDSTSDNQYPLVVKGLMIAKAFEFKRQYAGTVENPTPSELIIYDGRLQSNPMAGMTDFATALPNSVNVGP